MRIALTLSNVVSILLPALREGKCFAHEQFLRWWCLTRYFYYRCLARRLPRLVRSRRRPARALGHRPHPVVPPFLAAIISAPKSLAAFKCAQAPPASCSLAPAPRLWTAAPPLPRQDC